MKKQTFARKLIMLLLLGVLVYLTIFVSYRVFIAQDKREEEQEKFEQLVWSVYKVHAFHGNEIPNYEYELYESHHCSCPCPDTKNDSIHVRYYDKQKDTIVTGLLFESYPYRSLFEKNIKPLNKYLVIHTYEGGAYADEFSPVPVRIEIYTQEIVLEGRDKNLLYIKVANHNALNEIIEHIENYIPTDIPVL